MSMSMSMSMNFNGSIDMPMEVSKKIVLIAQDLAERAVKACGEHYGFDSEEAIRLLNLRNIENKKMNKKVVKDKGVSIVKSSFPLPYNGEYMEGCCDGLRYNNGLYTQCQVVRKGVERYCKGCQLQSDKNANGKPDYGTIQDRNAVGIFEYVDPSGKSPSSYLKVMKKLNLSKEDVIFEAKKMNKTIAEGHFEVIEKDTKRGRPKVEKVVKEKQMKGRPKKEKKVVEISGDLEDLFAGLMINEKDLSDDDNMSVDSNKENEEKLAAEKEEKEAKLAAQKAVKKSKLAAEKEEKEAKLAAQKEEKEAKLAAQKAEKEAKRKQDKSQKDENKKVTPSKKESKTSSEEDKADKVKKFNYEGVDYYRSTNTGVIYNMDQDVIGVWNKTTEKIDFTNGESEEDEEDYEEDD